MGSGSGARVVALAQGLRWAGPCPPPPATARHRSPLSGLQSSAERCLFRAQKARRAGARRAASRASCGSSGLSGAVRTHVDCRASTSELFSLSVSLSLFFKPGILFSCSFCLFLFLALSTIFLAAHLSLHSPPTCAPSPDPR